MAPLPVTNTARFFLDYTVGDLNHEAVVRFDGNLVAVATVVDTVASILGFIATSLYDDFAVTGARVAQAGVDFTLPVDITGTDLEGFTGDSGSSQPGVDRPKQIKWVGRSQESGRRVTWGLYGASTAVPANYRFGPGESAFSASPTIAALNAASNAGIFIAIDGERAAWKSYVNVQYNSYWETRVRG